MHTDDHPGKLIHYGALQPGQEVHVRVGREDLGRGRVDDVAGDGRAVWVYFGGASPRRLFIEEDAALFELLSGG